MLNCTLTNDDVYALAREYVRSACSGRTCLSSCLGRLRPRPLALRLRGGGGARTKPAACGLCGDSPIGGIGKSLGLFFILLFLVFAVGRILAQDISPANDVTCTWDGGNFVCSGSGGGEVVFGDNVIVIGGGSTGSGGDSVVTNCWGVCTNCVNMSSNQVESIRTNIYNLVSEVISLLTDVSIAATNINAAADDCFTDGDLMIDFPYVQTPVASNRDFVTNFLSHCDGDVFHEYYSPSQCRIVGEVFNDYFGNLMVAARGLNGVAAGHALYVYFNDTLRARLEDVFSFTDNVILSSDSAISSVSEIRRLASDLSSEVCPGSACPTNAPSGGGSTPSGRWCTEEQGDAIISYLSNLERWAERTHNQVVAILDTFTKGLYSDYTHIPQGADWQSIYFNSNSKLPWGYDPTNTLQRIELLLYGLVVTNGSPESFTTLSDPEKDEPLSRKYTNDWDHIMSSIDTNSVFVAVDVSKNLYDALKRLFESFSPAAAEFEGGELVVGGATLHIGESEFAVPAIALGNSDSSSSLSSFVRDVRGYFHVFLSFVYIVSGALVVWQSWCHFGEWALRISHWGIELASQMFS